MDEFSSPQKVAWEVDFHGLLTLLGKSLYTHSEVLIRELLQNAFDAIVMRREQDAEFVPRVDIDIHPDERRLVVRDNGIGLDGQDMKRLLSVIAGTNKPEYRRAVEQRGRAAESELVGQFGIGFLSVFIAADRVSVTSRKANSSSGYRWTNDGAIESIIERANVESVGTLVEIYIQSGAEFDYLLNASAVTQVIRKYMDYLLVPIHLNKAQKTVNSMEAPWDDLPGELSNKEKRQKLAAFVNTHFRDIPLELLPVNLPVPSRARGILYITDDRTPTIQTGGNVELLVRRVCIAQRDPTFLPDWAKFVSGIIDAPDLSVNAARD